MYLHVFICHVKHFCPNPVGRDRVLRAGLLQWRLFSHFVVGIDAWVEGTCVLSF